MMNQGRGENTNNWLQISEPAPDSTLMPQERAFTDTHQKRSRDDGAKLNPKFRKNHQFDPKSKDGNVVLIQGISLEKAYCENEYVGMSVAAIRRWLEKTYIKETEHKEFVLFVTVVDTPVACNEESFDIDHPNSEASIDAKNKKKQIAKAWIEKYEVEIKREFPGSKVIIAHGDTCFDTREYREVEKDFKELFALGERANRGDASQQDLSLANQIDPFFSVKATAFYRDVCSVARSYVKRHAGDFKRSIYLILTEYAFFIMLSRRIVPEVLKNMGLSIKKDDLLAFLYPFGDHGHEIKHLLSALCTPDQLEIFNILLDDFVKRKQQSEPIPIPSSPLTKENLAQLQFFLQMTEVQFNALNPWMKLEYAKLWIPVLEQEIQNHSGKSLRRPSNVPTETNTSHPAGSPTRSLGTNNTNSVGRRRASHGSSDSHLNTSASFSPPTSDLGAQMPESQNNQDKSGHPQGPSSSYGDSSSGESSFGFFCASKQPNSELDPGKNNNTSGPSSF